MAIPPCKAIALVIAAFNSLTTAGEPQEGVRVDIDKFCSMENSGVRTIRALCDLGHSIVYTSFVRFLMGVW